MLDKLTKALECKGWDELQQVLKFQEVMSCIKASHTSKVSHLKYNAKKAMLMKRVKEEHPDWF